ncbi:MAG: hypothetical protein ACREQY_13460 [Candidatus Binatia bacterium]
MPRNPRLRTAASRTAVLVALAAALTLSPAAALAADDDSSFRLHISGEDGGRLDLDLPLGWIASFVDWADVECDADTDRKVRRMMQSLDRQGEGGVYEFEDDDGDEVVARRVKGTLRIENREQRGEVAKVEMPWPLAECLILGREPEGGLARALKSGDFRVQIEGADGGKLTIDVDR